MSHSLDKLNVTHTPTWREVLNKTALPSDPNYHIMLNTVDYLLKKVVIDLDSCNQLEKMLIEFEQLVESNDGLSSQKYRLIKNSVFLLQHNFDAIVADEKRQTELFRVFKIISKYGVTSLIEIFLKHRIVDVRLSDLELLRDVFVIDYEHAGGYCKSIYEQILNCSEIDKLSNTYIENNKKIDFVISRIVNWNSPAHLFRASSSFFGFDKNGIWSIGLIKRVLDKIDPALNDHSSLMARVYSRLCMTQHRFQLIEKPKILNMFAVWSLKSILNGKYEKITVGDIDEYFDRITKIFFQKHHTVGKTERAQKKSSSTNQFDPESVNLEKVNPGSEMCNLLLSLVDSSADKAVIDRCLHYAILLSFSKEVKINISQNKDDAIVLDEIVQERSSLQSAKKEFMEMFCKCRYCNWAIHRIDFGVVDDFYNYAKLHFYSFFEKYKKIGPITNTALNILSKILSDGLITDERSPIEVSFDIVSKKFLNVPMYSSPLSIYRQVKIEKYIENKTTEQILTLIWHSTKMKYGNFSIANLDDSLSIEIPRPELPVAQDNKKSISFEPILKMHNNQIKSILSNNKLDNNDIIIESKNSYEITSIEILTKQYDQFCKIAYDLKYDLSTKNSRVNEKDYDEDYSQNEDYLQKVDLLKFKEIIESLEMVKNVTTSKNKRKRKLETEGDSKFDRYPNEETVQWICCKSIISNTFFTYYGPAEHITKTVYFTDKSDVTDTIPILKPHIFEIDLNNIAQHLIDLICISEEISSFKTESDLSMDLSMDLSDLNFRELIELLSHFYGSVYTIDKGHYRVIKSFEYLFLKSANKELSLIGDKNTPLYEQKLSELNNSLKKAKPFLKPLAIKYDMGALWFCLETIDF